jgi:predicted ester cyclase
MNMKVEDAFGTADKVVVRWSGKMTHSGDGLGMRATGKPVRLSGISIARIIDGKIVEGWDHWDQLGMLEQIGAYARPDAPPLQKSA